MAHVDAREGKLKGKLANGVGSQYSSHYLETWCIQHYCRWCAHLGCQQSIELTSLPIWMDSCVSQKDEFWFLRVCHHVSTGLYFAWAFGLLTCAVIAVQFCHCQRHKHLLVQTELTSGSIKNIFCSQVLLSILVAISRRLICRRRKHVPRKRRCICVKPHGVTPHTSDFLFAAAK